MSATGTVAVPGSQPGNASIKGEHPTRTGNRKLKHAFFLAAFAALSDPQQDVLRQKDSGGERNTTPR
jgi:hypothetical protein